MGIDFLDLTAFGHGLQPDLKALWVKIGSLSGGKQQIVRIRPIAVGHREDVPDQQLAEAIRNRSLPVGAFGFGRTLDNQVRFLCRVIVEDFNVRVVRREGIRRNTQQILVNRQSLPLGIEVRNLQRQQFTNAIPYK